MSNHPNIRPLLFLAIFLLGAIWTYATRPAATDTTQGEIPAPQTGFLAPPFSAMDISGREVAFTSFSGEVLIINFWASWCPPCRAEMPVLQEIYQDYNSKGLTVLGINAAFQDSSTKMNTFLDSYNVRFPIFLDSTGMVNRQYEIQSLPTTFFVGRDGIIRDMVIGGPLSYAGLEERIKPLIQEPR
jgi:cytochrome c biogenesis protein CcmG/thiol:disulfide interchange protein DsbE